MIRLTFNILNKKEKISFFFLVVLFFFTSFLEVLGIGLIYPIINLILNDSYLENFYYKKYLSDLNFTKFQITCIGLGILSLIYLFKNLIVFFVKYLTFNYRKKVDLRVTKQVISKYLLVSYEKIYNKTTEQILKNVTFTRDFSSTIFSLINIVQEAFIYIFILSVLIIVNPKLVLIISVVFLIIILIFYIIGKKIIYNLGNRFQINLEIIFKMIVEVVSAIKIIKLIGKEKYFLNKIQNRNLNEANIRNKSDLILQIPSHLIEVCAVISISLIIIYLTYEQNNFNEIIATVAIFAIAIGRLMPSTTRLIAYMQTLRYNLPKTKIIHDELYTFNNKEYFNLTEKKKGNRKKINFKNKITFNKVSFNFDSNKKKIFSNLSLEIKKKEVIGIFGPSGSGKSTFNNLLSGLLKPKSGEILVDGININQNMRSWQSNISFVSQNPFYSNDTIKNNILFGENFSDFRKKDFENALKLSQLENLLNTIPKGFNAFIGEKGINLSSGQLQRVSIARALYKNPNILILDEATNALDEYNEKQFLNCIKKLKRKITTIIISHKKSNFYFCDKIYKVSKSNLKKIN